MKRFYFISQLLLCCFINLIAQNISSYEAENIATRIFQMHNLDTNIKDIKPLNTSDVATLSDDSDSNPYLYIIETLDNDWIVLAADSVIPPILAMGSGGFPSVSDMPPAMRDLFESYIDEIKYIIDTLGITEKHPEWDLLTNSDISAIDNFDYDKGDCLLNDPIRGENLWRQDKNNEADNNENCNIYDTNKVYNKYCPIFTQSDSQPKKAKTGCGAIVMGQIMWYWQWPNIGIIPDTIFSNGENNGTYDLHFYNWDLMPNAIYNYTPQEQADMIAYFLRDCGYAAKMEYNYDNGLNSLTLPEPIKTALTESFNYKCAGIKEKNKTDNWGQQLRQELKSGRPIIYCGYNEARGNGHVFVIDGYKGIFNNLFHINWGWGNFNDPEYKKGFYYLNKLLPLIKDNAFENYLYNLNYHQKAIFGLEPDITCGHASIYGGGTIANIVKQISATGSISIASTKITNNSDIVINAGVIELHPGFEITEGCDVYLNTLSLDCNNTYSISYMPQYENKINIENHEFVSENNINLSIKENNLIINADNRDISSITLYNLHGQIISSTNTTNVNLSQVPSGVYIIKIIFTDNYSLTKKIIL